MHVTIKKHFLANYESVWQQNIVQVEAYATVMLANRKKNKTSFYKTVSILIKFIGTYYDKVCRVRTLQAEAGSEVELRMQIWLSRTLLVPHTL